MPVPPAPLEQRRKRGRSPGRDSGGRKLPDAENVVALRGVEGGLPPVPETLLPDGDGARRWAAIWSEAKWLSPATDAAVVRRLCEAVDLHERMREALLAPGAGFYVRGSQGQLRPNPLLNQIRATGAEILALERECGLTPSARGRMGVGEVKDAAADNPLVALLQQQAQRTARAGRG